MGNARFRRIALITCGVVSTASPLLAGTANWTGEFDRYWHNPGNWTTNPAYPNNTPATSYDVVFQGNLPSTATIHEPFYQNTNVTTVDSIRVDSPTTIKLYYGTLRVNNEFTVNNGLVRFAGGTTFSGIIGGTGGTVSVADGGAGATFDNVTLRRNIVVKKDTDFSDAVRVLNGLTLDGGSIVPGAGLTKQPLIRFYGSGTQALAGAGYLPSITVSSGTVDVASGISIGTLSPGANPLTGAGSIGIERLGIVRLHGKLEANDPTDGRVGVTGEGTFANDGYVHVPAGNLFEGGTNLLPGTGTWQFDAGSTGYLGANNAYQVPYRLADIGTIINASGMGLSIVGPIDNSNATIGPNDLNPSFALDATVVGGTVAVPAGKSLNVEGTIFKGVRLVGDMFAKNTVSGAYGGVDLVGATTFDIATIHVLSEGTNDSRVKFDTTSNITGTGRLELKSAHTAFATGIGFVVGSGIAIDFVAPNATLNDVYPPTTNYGRYDGPITATGNLTINMAQITNTAYAAGMLTLMNARAAGATVSVGPSGKVVVDDMNAGDLPVVAGAAALEYRGVIDLQGGSFDPTTVTTGSTTFFTRDAGFKNGTILLSQPLALSGGPTASNNNLDAVKLQGDLTIPTNVRLQAANGLEIAGSLTVSGYFDLFGNQTVSADRPILLRGGAIRCVSFGASTPTIAAGTTIDVLGSGSISTNDAGAIRVLGNVDVHGPGTSFTITTASLPGSLTVRDGAKATFGSAAFYRLDGAVTAKQKSLVIGIFASSATSLSTGTVTIGDAGLWQLSSVANPVQGLRVLLGQGYGNGTWNGTAGIRLGGTDVPVGADALGFVPAASFLAHHPGYSLGGTKITSTGYIVLPTLAGDANLDFKVDFTDLVTLAQSYSVTTGKLWANGDFTYDGAVDFNDLAAIAQHYGKSLNSSAPISVGNFEADWALALSLVPEPGILSSLLLAGSIVCARRR